MERPPTLVELGDAVESGTVDDPVAFGVDGLQSLVDVLADEGREVLGPRASRGVVTIGPLASTDDLPRGWTDEQAPGHYRLREGGGDGFFGWTVGPLAWKPLLHPPHAEQGLADPASMREDDLEEIPVRVRPSAPPRRAFVGVRPCEVAAIAAHDTVLRDSSYPDPVYAGLREDLFVVAVDCTEPAATCFCTSAGTGPDVGCTDAHDIADLRLTELSRPDHELVYLAHGMSARGGEVLAAVADRTSVRPADPALTGAAEGALDRARVAMTDRFDPAELRDTLRSCVESDAWERVAEACVACGNCTAVCPTCFCTRTDDRTDLDGVVHRTRVWDSCFGLEFSRVGEAPVRSSLPSRYRQWLLHKLSTWHDQFGERGCVGCGRCITWCPVGIDIISSATAVRSAASGGGAS